MPRYLLEACPQNHDHYALNSDSRTNTVPNVMRTEELRNGTQFQLGTSKGQFNGMEEGTRERKLMVLQQQPSHELFKLSVAVLKSSSKGYDDLEHRAPIFNPQCIIAGGSAYPREWEYERF